ncbi:MAG: sugar/nucleoside kinase (ribokinase family) [Saprospiraceae bacterium]
MSTEISYICIGHVCHDIVEDGVILGGTASYSSIVSTRLGMNTGVVTSFGSDFEFVSRFEEKNIHLWVQESKETTSFRNIYKNGTRTQYMPTRAKTIGPETLPEFHKGIKAIQLCLISDEVDLNLLSALPSGIPIGATIQGWLRNFEKDGLVKAKLPNLKLFEHLELVFMSDDDIREVPQLLDQIIKIVPIVVLTRGKHGADVYENGTKHTFPAYPSEEIDPTGAGDVFSTAFMISYSHNRNISRACSFAHCAASLSIEGMGVKSIPTREEVFERQILYFQKFGE